MSLRIGSHRVRCRIASLPEVLPRAARPWVCSYASSVDPGGCRGDRGKASMELQASTLYPASATVLPSDTVELLTPTAASLAKLAAVLRPATPLAAAAVETILPD